MKGKIVLIQFPFDKQAKLSVYLITQSEAFTFEIAVFK